MAAVAAALACDGCLSPARGTTRDVGTGGALGDIGPGATVHTLTLTNSSTLLLVLLIVAVLAAAGYALWRSHPIKETRP